MELTLDLGELKTIGEGRAPDPEQLYDVLILGGGPAAMTAAVYVARKMLSLASDSATYGYQKWESPPYHPATRIRIFKRAAVEFIPWLGLPAAALELEAPVTTGTFSSAARFTNSSTRQVSSFGRSSHFKSPAAY